jgi:curved DNA-binding protein CbpA
MLGPAMPAPELLAEAALLSEQFAGPPPPELVAEAEGASSESREQAAARVLRCLALPDAERDAYAVLALQPGASAGEVKKAYWRLSLLIHPDKCSHPRAAEAFAALAKARDELADGSARAALDARRAEAALRAEFNAELAGKVQAAQWRRTRGLAPLPDDELLLDGDADARAGGREEWMTALPPEKQVRAGAPPVPTTSVAAFSRVERTGRGDTSEWTDTPVERAARMQRNLLEGPTASARPGALMGSVEQQQAAALVDQYNAAKRPMSLVEAHQARLAAEAKAAKKAKRKGGEAAAAEAPPGGAPWRAFDRDKDLQAPRKSGATTDYMQTLPGRFQGASGNQPRKFL